MATSTPSGLPTTRPSATAAATLQVGPVERRTSQRDAGVGEREHGHDAERDPGVERLDQALGGRHGLTARVLDLA